MPNRLINCPECYGIGRKCYLCNGRHKIYSDWNLWYWKSVDAYWEIRKEFKIKYDNLFEIESQKAIKDWLLANPKPRKFKKRK
jgi:hypothetical protein